MARLLADSIAAASGRAVAAAIRLHGTPDQRARLLPRLEEDPARGAYAFAEEAAGADAAAIETTIDGGRAAGRKVCIANAPSAEVFLVVGRARGADRLSAVLVEGRGGGVAAGVGVSPRRPPLGLEGLTLGDVSFDGAPAEPLGEAGEGYAVAETVFAHGRAGTAAAAARAAALCLGAARRRAEAAVRYGRPLAEHEAVADILDEAACDVFACEAVAADAAARLKTTGAASDGRLEAASAKAFAGAALARLAADAGRIAGIGAEAEALERAGAAAAAVRRAFGADEILHAYVALAGVEGVRAYLRETDAAMRSVFGFAKVWPLYALRRARLAFGRPPWPDAPAAAAEPALLVRDACGILAWRAFDLAFRRPGLLARSGRLQQGIGRIAVEVYAAAASVARATAETETTAWKIAARAHDRVARASREIESAILAADEESE